MMIDEDVAINAEGGVTASIPFLGCLKVRLFGDLTVASFSAQLYCCNTPVSQTCEKQLALEPFILAYHRVNRDIVVRSSHFGQGHKTSVN